MKQVLLVEDEVNIRMLVSVILESAGLQVTAVESFNQALAELAAQRPDLILTDKHLRGGGDGCALIKTVHERFAENPVPVILLSGSVESSRRMALELEPYERVVFMRKPFDVAELQSQVEAMLAD